jgi:hypothetical protein
MQGANLELIDQYSYEVIDPVSKMGVTVIYDWIKYDDKNNKFLFYSHECMPEGRRASVVMPDPQYYYDEMNFWGLFTPEAVHKSIAYMIHAGHLTLRVDAEGARTVKLYKIDKTGIKVKKM